MPWQFARAFHSEIELSSTWNHRATGELGPSTIVGSAAFNLFCIMAVCVTCLPAGETRKIADLGVFGVTAVCSVFAYIWLLVILVAATPDVVTITEGALTFGFFPLLVMAAYAADKGYFTARGQEVWWCREDVAHNRWISSLAQRMRT